MSQSQQSQSPSSQVVAEIVKKTTVRCSRSALLDAVAEAKRFADPKATMPILAMVLLRQQGSSLVVAATDLNMSCRSEVLAVSGDGDVDAACLDAKKLHEVLKALPGDEVAIEVVTTAAPKSAATTLTTLISGKSRFRLQGLSGRDFPKLPTVEMQEWHRLAASPLRQVLDVTLPTISLDETRSHLNGAKLEIRDGKVRAVSTDGHRLTLCERDVVTTLRCDAVLPRHGVVEILKFLATATPKPRKGATQQGDVEVALHGGHLSWRTVGGATTYTCKLTDAQFPPYEQVIPRDVSKSAAVPREALLAGLKRMCLAASEKTSGVRLTWDQAQQQVADPYAAQHVGAASTPSPAKLTLSTDNPYVGDASEEVDGVIGAGLWDWSKKDKRGDAVDGAVVAPFVFGVNARYLIGALEELHSDTVWIGMNGELDPCVVKATEQDVDVIVIMPMRL